MSSFLALVLRLVRVTVLFLLLDLLVLLLASGEEAAWSHAADGDGANLTKLSHALVGVVLLDHLGVVIGMLDLDMLIQTSLRTVALWAVLNRTFVMSCDLSGSSPVSLFLLIIDFEGHAQHFFVFALI